MSLYVDIEKDLGSFKLKVKFEQENGIVGLLGQSGCGKSMTLKCIAGIVKPDKGKIISNGTVFFDSEKKINLTPQKRNIGFLFQNYALFPHMSVKENIQLGIEKLSKEEKDEITKKYLKKFRLEGFEDRYPWQLSGGQQQRIALARALCLNPDILILDEPFSALDYHLRSNMENELCEILKDFDGNVLFVTHDISEAYRISDDIIVFDSGVSLPKRKKDELFVHPRCMTEAVITGCKNISSCDIIDTNTVFAKEWGFKCKIENGVDENSKHVGIRAHHMKVVQDNQEILEDSENIFEMTVVKVIENSFTYNIHIKNCDNENNLSLQMEVDKNIRKVELGQKIRVKFDKNSVFDF
ncbi:MAG: ATP-binding cassette domain-containing protein [Intestinibacter bartlettii]|uniref:sulfate/molybdate ABC transporter ATP-binding protein n=1 Tax=Intestinibacter bartlettii TaxID=261299 RepID=UPI0026F15073|nr:ATP-binding cassette domain-containing protein [Intestinibacter bartlettii]MDO5010976.1 ATP-binding cassette domain-containing protein [Intestinibacter bartlettii]